MKQVTFYINSHQFYFVANTEEVLLYFLTVVLKTFGNLSIDVREYDKQDHADYLGRLRNNN